MITSENIGQHIRYWNHGMASGEHIGILLRLEGSTAVIKHPVKKKEQKVPVRDCEALELLPTSSDNKESEKQDYHPQVEVDSKVDSKLESNKVYQYLKEHGSIQGDNLLLKELNPRYPSDAVWSNLAIRYKEELAKIGKEIVASGKNPRIYTLKET